VLPLCIRANTFHRALVSNPRQRDDCADWRPPGDPRRALAVERDQRGAQGVVLRAAARLPVRSGW
jgi:hypothetical protein